VTVETTGARRRDDRGTVLVLAVMILLVLSAIAFVAVQATMNQMARVQAFRTSAVAGLLTAAGSEATLAVAATNPSGFDQFLAANNFAVLMADVSPSFFDTSQAGSFGQEVVTLNTANWASRLSNPIATSRAPGFEGSFCFKRYRSETDGIYRNDVASGAPLTRDQVLQDLRTTAQKRFAATMYVGPVDCENQ
jgi:hypothetical protein